MSRPPRFAEWLLRRVVPERDRRSLPDELRDLHAARLERTGPAEARRWYVRTVLGFVIRLPMEGGRRVIRSGMGGGEMGMVREVLFAWRRLVRAPLFTIVASFTLGAGIAAFASVYATVDAVLLEAPPYEEPDELRYVWRSYSFLDRGWLGGPDLAQLAEYTDVFDGVVGLRLRSANLTSADGTAPRRVRIMLASADFFEVLGVSPALGRGFLPGEDGTEAAPVAVLSHDLWSTQFGADPTLPGRDVYLDGNRVTVVGVAPESFHFVRHSSTGDPSGADLWMPLPFDLAALDPGNGMFSGFVRVGDGVSPAQVDAAVTAVGQRLDDEFGNPGVGLWSVGLLDDLTSEVRPALLTLLASASFLLLVLAANLTTLLIGRAALRDRELAVRTALGAGAGSVVRSVVAESLVLAGLGAVIGLAAAGAGTELIRTLAPDNLPRLWAIEIDGSVVVASVVAAVLLSVVAGLLPLRGALGADLTRRLREGGRGGTGRGSRARAGLVVTQLALSLVLLVSAGLLAQAFEALSESDPGFDAEGVLSFRVSLDLASYPDGEAIVAFERTFRESLSALPGVTHVGASDVLPLADLGSQWNVRFPDAPGNTGDPEEDALLVDRILAGPDFVEAAGIRIIAGRSFRDGDGVDGRPAALIDDVLAGRFFSGGDPVGALAVTGGDTLHIVGVVDQPRLYDVHRDGRGQIYVPLEALSPSELTFAVRASSDPEPLLPEVRRALAGIDSSLPVSQPRLLDEIVVSSLGRERLSMTILGFFAGAALLLAALGVYGVVANGVTLRTREMGIRMALGATRDGVVTMVLREGLRLGMFGMAVGSVVAFGVSPLLDRVIVGLEASSPTVYLTTAAALLLSTLAASVVPARRATRIDPAEALRQE